MAQFTFKLDGVLRHRKNVEHERQRDVAVVQARMTELEIRLRNLDAEVKASNDAMRRDHLVGAIDLDFLTAHRRYLASTGRLAMEIAQKMAVIQRQLNAARQLLSDAARDRKVLEKLRENQEESWKAEMNRKRAAEQDEVAMQMYYRARSRTE